MRGVGGTTLRGGQTVFHGIRMWGQLLQAGMMLGALIVVAVPAWNLWHTTTGADWYAAGILTLAEVKLAIGYQPDSGQVVRDRDGVRRVLSIQHHRIVGAGGAHPRADPGRGVPKRVAGRQGRGRRDRALPRLVLVPGRAARAQAPRPGRRARDRGATPPAHPAALGSASWKACRGGSGSAPTGSRASRSRPEARPSTPSSRAPRARARRC